ncbi:CTB family bacteriocin [Leptolyngbya sp. NIES-2104]|uniref:CTB family bacteriocin n=1 Tax=Leptolyngbya sp. NIES-2104 TaxID=1552121 RepID=UPI0006ECA683|nr:CTB family bacteriocin [Leptolyngbya sp. NIES-2104]GAP94201.1 hypothetical protein NIES2104_07120 [Leptolyngbya sp. NIES-2104]
MSEQIKINQTTELSVEELDNVAGGLLLDVENSFDVKREANATLFEVNEKGTSFIDLNEVEKIDNDLDISKQS